jgi:hypothetical protein
MDDLTARLMSLRPPRTLKKLWYVGETVGRAMREQEAPSVNSCGLDADEFGSALWLGSFISTSAMAFRRCVLQNSVAS